MFNVAMAKRYSILFRKDTSGNPAVKDSVRDWNLACTSIPFLPVEETKDVYERDWKDRDGVDAYTPSILFRKAYDWEISLCYKGDLGSAYEKITSFIDYLTGADNGGAFFSVYSPYAGIGKSGCYLKSFAPDGFWSKGEDILEFSITLRVTSPESSITLES